MRPLNPFEPNRPISPSQFVGREKEVAELDAALVHLKHGTPRHFLVTGDRGIGKTSYLDLIRDRASHRRQRFNFLVLDFVIYRTVTQIDLIKGIEAELERAVAEYEPFRDFVKKSWSFIQRVEVAGVSLKQASDHPSERAIYKDVANALINTVDKICDQSSLVYGYDGVIILLDEVDQAPPQLDLGTFLKYLLETLNRRGCNRVAFGLAGLSSSRDILLESHRSSLRIFDELSLENLNRDDFDHLINDVLFKVREDFDRNFTITDDATNLIFEYSDGHPHFVHQFGYCAFEASVVRGGTLAITAADVTRGAISSRGAFDLLGDMYFRPSLEGVELEEFALQLLDYMTENPRHFFGEKEIAAQLGCDLYTISLLLRQMCGLSILHGDKGSYRVRYACFAYWYKSIRPQVV